MTKNRWLEIGAVGTLATALAAALLVPADTVQGNVQRIMYVHVPSAWLAYLAFGMTLLGSVAYLRRKDLRWDRFAAASAEVGVLFTGTAILLGMLWGKPVWGVYWTWDARLVLTAIMFFVYLGYLALRRAIPEPETRAKRSAILGIVGAVQIPLVHFSVIWWRSLHQAPTVLRPDLDPQIDPPMLAALLMSVFAFTVVYAALVKHRMELGRLEYEIEVAIHSDTRPVAGDAVAPVGETAVDLGSIR
jgi:heme exporter protein C